jgi:dGTPase
MQSLSTFETEVVAQFVDRERLILSEYATPSKDGMRRYEEQHPNIRPSFSRDADRILHSFAFTRYIDKTQVFYLSENDVITHRVIHVQLVSKIARLIARALKLNEDLVEAIALGHDIGHTPFGHDGEKYISNEITEKLSDNPFFFRHSIQSIRFMDKLEGPYKVPGGKSLNLTLQVLDGILCHDGEDPKLSLRPDRTKTWNDFDKDIENKMGKNELFIRPMTLEGCLVRVVDVIAYLGRDIEDAIAVGLINKESIPELLGDSNRDIVNNLAMDIIMNSRDKDEISYSEEAFEKLIKLLKFNYENIYNNPLIKAQKEKIKDIFCIVYDKLLSHIKNNEKDSPIFLDHVNLIDKNDGCYLQSNPPEIIVIDYISGMTDDYFINIFNELFLPTKLPFNFRQLSRITGLSKERLLELCR